ncbi:MAG: SET domain-containing protein-lysine N-methyltransferase [Blastocatellia bacterium]
MKTQTKTSGNQVQSLAPGIEVKASPIDGLGCYATRAFRRGQRIAEYVGERISRREIKRRLQGAKRIHICAIDTYWAIDGSVGGNGTEYINHSCHPNGDLKIINNRIFFYAARNIAPGEEITLDYVSSWHDDETKCSCGAPNCRGTINQL